MGPKIKIGIKEFEVVRGEYFLYNGHCLQYITKDPSKKKRGEGRWGSFNKSYYLVPKKRWKDIMENKKEYLKCMVKDRPDMEVYKPIIKDEPKTDAYSDKIRDNT